MIMLERNGEGRLIGQPRIKIEKEKEIMKKKYKSNM